MKKTEARTEWGASEVGVCARGQKSMEGSVCDEENLELICCIVELSKDRGDVISGG